MHACHFQGDASANSSLLKMVYMKPISYSGCEAFESPREQIFHLYMTPQQLLKSVVQRRPSAKHASAKWSVVDGCHHLLSAA